MSISSLSPDQIGEIFTAGIAKDLEAILKKNLHDKLDHIIDDFAVDLAKQIAVRVQSAQHFDHLAGTPKILLQVDVDRKTLAKIEMVPHVTQS